MRRFIVLLAALAAMAVATPTAGASGPGVSAFDLHFAMEAARSDRFEIASGQLALRRSANAEVRMMAQHIIRDHRASSARLARIARMHGIALPRFPAPLQQWALDTVATRTGLTFDRHFIALQVRAHEQAIMLYRHEIRWGTNRHLRAFARAGLPALVMHLEMARAARGGG